VSRLARAVLRAEGGQLAALSVSFVGPARIRALNRAHLGRDAETDVIALVLDGRWPARRGGGAALAGDIYICPAVASRSAKAWGASPKDEVRRLVIHGLLHVLGHEHPEGTGRTRSAMWRRQERHLARFRRLAP
jgi:probable rRNA maturation factor